jgi:hypothetical protein
MKLILNLRNAQSATCGWMNEYDHVVWGERKPERTFLGTTAHPDRPVEQHDKWRFFVRLNYGWAQFYTVVGDRAAAIWKLWKGTHLNNATNNEQRRKRKSTKTKHGRQLELLP